MKPVNVTEYNKHKGEKNPQSCYDFEILLKPPSNWMIVKFHINDSSSEV